MGIPVDPVSEFDAIFDTLREQLAHLDILSKTARRLPDGPEKDAILTCASHTVSLTESIFHNLRSAREKLSRRFS
jgi:hypothetical protein